jgi:hypothetical protein
MLMLGAVTPESWRRSMAEVQWRCPTHGVIDTVLDIINPDHPTCPVLLRRSIAGKVEAGECREPLTREPVER